jgi:cytoskeletal protein RodZ
MADEGQALLPNPKQQKREKAKEYEGETKYPSPDDIEEELRKYKKSRNTPEKSRKPMKVLVIIAVIVVLIVALMLIWYFFFQDYMPVPFPFTNEEL